jgi:hypothetical protein
LTESSDGIEKKNKVSVPFSLFFYKFLTGRWRFVNFTGNVVWFALHLDGIGICGCERQHYSKGGESGFYIKNKDKKGLSGRRKYNPR